MCPVCFLTKFLQRHENQFLASASSLLGICRIFHICFQSITVKISYVWAHLRDSISLAGKRVCSETFSYKVKQNICREYYVYWTVHHLDS